MNSIKTIQNVSEVPSKLGKTETAVAANKLATARTVNGTSFDGTSNITTSNWGTARNLTVGNTTKSVNGSTNVNWTLDEIGAAPTSHTHNEYITNDRIMDGAQAKIYLWSSDYIANNYLDYTSTAAKATKLATPRTITVGNTSKSFDGSENVSWSLSEIGAAASSHTHSYLPLSGGDISGRVNITELSASNGVAHITVGTSSDSNGSGDGNTHLGYYSDNWGGQTHYFRGKGAVVVDNHQSVQVNQNWMKLGGKKLSLTSSTPTSPATGDVWIQI